MLNGIEFVRQFCGAEPRVEKTVDVMDRQVQVMAGLVEDLMDSARISQGKVSLRRERIELVRTVKQAIETSRLLIDVRQQSFTLNAADEPIWLDADPARLIQIVVNLLNNAAKYTPEGGRICLSIEQVSGHGIVRVRDSGMGIQREMLTRVFDLYTQSEQAENDSTRRPGNRPEPSPRLRRVARWDGRRLQRRHRQRERVRRAPPAQFE